MNLQNYQQPITEMKGLPILHQTMSINNSHLLITMKSQHLTVSVHNNLANSDAFYTTKSTMISIK